MIDDTAKNTLIRRRVIRSTVANYIGQIITLGTGFLLTPFVLHRIGPAQYGLWVLVGSLVAYGVLFDFGISGAVVKYVAEYRARGEDDQAHSLVATALYLYTGLGLVVILLSAVIAPFFPDLFNLPAEQRTTAVWLVLISGTAIGVSIPCSLPSAILRGLQRFDLVNLISVGGTLLVAVTTIAVLLLGGGVVGMTAINIPLLLLMQVPSIWLVKHSAPQLRFGWRGASRRFVRTVMSYSLSIFVAQMSGQLQTKTDELVIGAFLPVTAVTPYAIARRLSEITGLLTNQFMKVLLPLASELHAENDHTRLRSLYIIGTRVTLAVFLPLGGTLIILARAVLTVWVGAAYADAAYLVIILTIASLIDTSQWPAGLLLQGMARHRPLVIMSAAAALANLALSLVLVQSLGVTGVALGTLIPTTVVGLGLVLPYAMRTIGVSSAEMLAQIIAPALLPAVPMAAILYTLVRIVQPASLLVIAAVAAAGLIVYASAYLSIRTNALERQVCWSLATSTLRFARARLNRS